MRYSVPDDASMLPAWCGKRHERRVEATRVVVRTFGPPWFYCKRCAPLGLLCDGCCTGLAEGDAEVILTQRGPSNLYCVRCLRERGELAH